MARTQPEATKACYYFGNGIYDSDFVVECSVLQSDKYAYLQT